MSNDTFRARLFSEYTELQVKLEKLRAFITVNELFTSLPEVDQQDLLQQIKHMQGYHDVLSRRVSRLCNNA